MQNLISVKFNKQASSLVFSCHNNAITNWCELSERFSYPQTGAMIMGY